MENDLHLPFDILPINYTICSIHKWDANTSHITLLLCNNDVIRLFMHTLMSQVNADNIEAFLINQPTYKIPVLEKYKIML